MIDQEDNIILGKILFDDNNQERKAWACLGQTCSRSLIVFLSNITILLEKETRTVRESVLVALSDTKEGFTLPKGKHRCMETGLCNI